MNLCTSLCVGLLVLAVSPSGVSAARPVFVVATTAAAGDEWDAVARRSSRAHHESEIVRFSPDALVALRDELRDRQARFVQFVVPPEVIDVNLCFELLELATTLDDDPFVDFSYGFITGSTPETATRFLERSLELVRSKKGVPRRILDNLGPNTQMGGKRVIPWLGPKWTAFARGYQSEIFTHGNEGLEESAVPLHEGRGLIHFGGHGDPAGITDGLSAAMVRGLELRRSVVFNGACSTGVTGRYYDTLSGGVQVKTYEPGELFCLRLLETGIAAYFAAVHPDHGIPVYQEMEFLLTTGAVCGDTMKHTYDNVVMGNGGGKLSCPRLEPGKGNPLNTPKTIMLFGTAARVLFGDPLARPVTKPVPGPFQIQVKKRGAGYRALVKLVNPAVKYSLQDTFHSNLSANRQQFNDRIYVRIPLDRVTEVNELSVARATSGSEELAHELVAYAVEHWHGEVFLHVQVDFPTTGYQISKMRTAATAVIIDFK